MFKKRYADLEERKRARSYRNVVALYFGAGISSLCGHCGLERDLIDLKTLSCLKTSRLRRRQQQCRGGETNTHTETETGLCPPASAVPGTLQDNAPSWLPTSHFHYRSLCQTADDRSGGHSKVPQPRLRQAGLAKGLSFHSKRLGLHLLRP